MMRLWIAAALALLITPDWSMRMINRWCNVAG